MAESDGVDGRRKAGHDGGGRPINSYRDKRPIVAYSALGACTRIVGFGRIAYRGRRAEGPESGP
jgi:hypothetical protein